MHFFLLLFIILTRVRDYIEYPLRDFARVRDFNWPEVIKHYNYKVLRRFKNLRASDCNSFRKKVNNNNKNNNNNTRCYNKHFYFSNGLASKLRTTCPRMQITVWCHSLASAATALHNAIAQTANQKVLYVLSFEGLLLLNMYLKYCKPEWSIYLVVMIYFKG